MQKLLKYQNSLTIQTRFLIVAGFAALSVSMSFFLEFGLGQMPCLLCLAQRGIHGLLFVIALMGICIYSKTVFRRCCQGLLIASCLVAGYHSMVQLNLVKDRCKRHSQVGDFESYKNLLLESRKTRPSCSEATWGIGPIPISGVNGLLSFCLLILISKSRKDSLRTVILKFSSSLWV